MDVRRTTLFTIICCFAGFFSGCHPENAEQKGDNETKSGRFDSAIYGYEAALGTEDRSSVHWKMAASFGNKLRDPARAAYDYRRSLSLQSSGARADAS